jgi:hypothetical protein
LIRQIYSFRSLIEELDMSDVEGDDAAAPAPVVAASGAMDINAAIQVVNLSP